MTSRQRATAAWREAEARLKLVRGMWREARAQGPEAVRLLREGRTATRHLPAVEKLESEDAAFAKERALHAAAPAGQSAARTHRRKTAHASAAAEVSRLEADAAGSGGTRAARAGRQAAEEALPAARVAAEEALAALPSVYLKRSRAKLKDGARAAAAVVDVLEAAKPPDRLTRKGRREALALRGQLEAARRTAAETAVAARRPAEHRRRAEAEARIPRLAARVEALRNDNSAAGRMLFFAASAELAAARAEAVPYRTRLDMNYRATAAAADALIRELVERGWARRTRSCWRRARPRRPRGAGPAPFIGEDGARRCSRKG